MNIRIIKSKDSKIIAEINKTVQNLHVAEYPEYFKTFDNKAVNEGISKILNDRNWYSYIAYADEIPAGYALFYTRQYNENPFRYKYRGIHIDQICVAEKYQGMNIGSLLVDKIEKFAIKNKMDQIELSYWEKNSSAKKFYNKHGFEEISHFAVKQLR